MVWSRRAEEGVETHPGSRAVGQDSEHSRFQTGWLRAAALALMASITILETVPRGCHGGRVGRGQLMENSGTAIARDPGSAALPLGKCVGLGAEPAQTWRKAVVGREG